MPQAYSVSDFIALANQTFEYAYTRVYIEGEISGFKINQGKFVFFDIKDESGTLGCFMTVWQMRQPIEDGMKVVVTATPKLTPWGKFSLTVQALQLQGEGSIRKGFDLLRTKLEKEGLFALERKRPLPESPSHIAVISSTQAAGYTDFIKILNDRWGGVGVDVAHVQVQGESAPDQMIRALRFFNEQEILPEVIVMVRGGGSADDLQAFNDELLVREIAASRIPVLTGIGHEVDISLADLTADVRAATPSNAAQLIVPDRGEAVKATRRSMEIIIGRLEQRLVLQQQVVSAQVVRMVDSMSRYVEYSEQRLTELWRTARQFNPQAVLERGYAIVRGHTEVGGVVEIETREALIKAKVESYEQTGK